MSVFIYDSKRKKIIKDIHDFLKKPASSGGMFVLCGIRGSGKRRVVDQALSKHNKLKKPDFINYGLENFFDIIDFIIKQFKFFFLFYLWGYLRTLDSRNIERKILSIRRFPRHIKRHIIKVDIRFPLEKDPNNLGQSIQGSFLNSLIFELTSQLDPRSSRRLHAKTLRQRLGFWNYWFSFNGLILPDLTTRAKYFHLLFVWFEAVFLIYILKFKEVPFPIILITGFIVLLVSWWILRFLDWQGFKRFNDRLYAITHANKMKESVDILYSNIKKNNINQSIARIAAIITFSLSVAAFYLRLNPIKLDNKENSELFFNVVSFLSEYLNSYPTIIFLIIAFIFSMLYLQRFSLRGLGGHFDGDNSEWKITLLRRYLFLLHQLGIEPILVLAELDKLEKIYKIKQQSSEVNKIEIKGLDSVINHFQTEDNNKNIPKKEDVIEIHGLDLLFDELIPLKQNIGTDFLWILIGGTELMSRITQLDNDFPPKAEATIIQKYSYLGVINREQTYQYLTKNDDKKITLEQADFFWIMSRGLYSVLYSQNKKKLEQFQGLTTEAKKLAKMCEICIEPDFVKGFLSSPSLHNILSVSDLHDQFYNYLLMGILYQARFELLGLGYKTTEISEQNYTDNINIQLLINNPEKVIQIGRNLFSLMYNHHHKNI